MLSLFEWAEEAVKNSATLYNGMRNLLIWYYKKNWDNIENN